MIEQPIRKISTSQKRGLLFGLFAAQTLVLVGLRRRPLDTWPTILDAAEYAKLSKFKKTASLRTKNGSCAGIKIRGMTFASSVNLNLGQRPILLWGDSMANSALPAFESLAELRPNIGNNLRNTQLPTLAWCCPRCFEASTCLEMNSNVLETLKSARPTDVYLFARWPHYAEGVHSNMWGDPGKVGFIDFVSNPVDAETITVFKDALSKLLAEIGSPPPRGHHWCASRIPIFCS